jgi:hypothetical protein
MSFQDKFLARGTSFLNLKPSRLPLKCLAALSAESAFPGGVNSDTILKIFPQGIGNPCSARKLPFFLT